MLEKTPYTTSVSPEDIARAIDHLPRNDFRFTLNAPLGNLLYEPWQILEQYQGTVWDQLLQSLPVAQGEARIIILESGQCYQSHGDLDDRYHLSLSGTDCYAVNLETNMIYPMVNDGHWYEFLAGQRHSAANFGRDYRVQLVVRKLLTRNRLVDPLPVEISSTLDLEDTRFYGENTISPWLNTANKLRYVTDVEMHENSILNFSVERRQLENLRGIIPSGLNLRVL